MPRFRSSMRQVGNVRATSPPTIMHLNINVRHGEVSCRIKAHAGIPDILDIPAPACLPETTLTRRADHQPDLPGQEVRKDIYHI